jgi:predicted cation transporter
MAGMGFIAIITFHHSESVIVRVVTTAIVGCINAIIDVQREKRIDNRLDKIEEEVNKLRKS